MNRKPKKTPLIFITTDSTFVLTQLEYLQLDATGKTSRETQKIFWAN